MIFFSDVAFVKLQMGKSLVWWIP